MNKKLLLSLILGGTAVSGLMAQSKMDAGAMMALDTYRAVLARGASAAEGLDFNGLPFTAESILSRADRPVSVFVVLNDGASAADLEARGFEVTTDLGDVVVALGSMEQIAALEECDFVKSISFGEKRTLKMDKTRAVTGADAIQAGQQGLPMAYDGKGVICGIYDTGLDPNHVNFLDQDKVSRVKAVWCYTSSDGVERAYLTPDAIARFTTDNTGQSHGTHTLGIMAGAYKGNTGRVSFINEDDRVVVSTAFRKYANPYYGMAPESDILIGCGELYDPNIISGVKNIVNYAKEHNQRAVINLSLGGNMGPHDGTDATALALERLGEDAFIFIAAGNEAYDNISIDEVLGTPAQFSTLMNTNRPCSGNIDFWSATSEEFTLIPLLQDLATGKTTEACELTGAEEGVFKLGTNGISGNTWTNSEFDKAFTSSSVLMTVSKNASTNKRYNVRVNVTLRPNGINNKDGKIVLGFKIVGKTGQRIQVVSNVDRDGEAVAFTSMGQAGFIDGTPDFTISSMCCGKNVVSVGAWNARNEWPVLAGGRVYYTNEGYAVGEPAQFSSYGVLADGRSLPTLVAPGSAVVSSISTPYMNTLKAELGDVQFPTYVNNTESVEQTVNGSPNYWEAESGTSMATPAVAGGVALWLQAKPDLTYDEMVDALVSTATKDALCPGRYPAAKVGAGKFNALDGLKKILGLPLGVVDMSADTDRNFFVTVREGDVEAYSATAGLLEATLVNLQGATVAKAAATGNTVTIATDGMQAGIYVLSVETPAGRYNRKITVK